ncbi:unnamed protein product [Adineta steineri]|uniref:Uncharacterized protein n=1 Tax=Adineta steineri TaxID=433720 RepID=A0A819S869_9BILA|nr:unnamed protein product [Adineta steineri]CAF4057321.1 unnamed protein product [Adineta steineri]
MRIWFLLFIPVVVLQAQSLRTFGIGLSSQWLYPNETEIFNYTLTSRGSWGVLTHFWATGDPAIDLSTFSYYIDGENVPSIQFVSYMSTLTKQDLSLYS